MTFYIKNTNERSILYKIAPQILKLLKFTQCTHRSLRANNLILLLNLDITIYINNQYENTKYSRSCTFTHKIQFISFPS